MTRIQIRRGTSAQWAAANPVLQQGELAYEIDTNKVKIGDGSAVWNSLGYVSLDWATLAGKPTYLAAGSTKSAARSAIDAEEIIAAGTTSQYYRGDKSFQTLDKAAVGLGDVDNTTDANKPVSTATQSALDGKADDVHLHVTSDVTGLDTALSAKEDAANKGAADGYASLDGDGLVPQAQLPITTSDWATLEGKPAVVAAGATEAEARAAISAEYAGDKGQPDGYASLDASGYIPLDQWGAQVLDGGSAAVSTIDVINGGSA